MTQHELDDAVADATGEDLREIRHRGFSLADPLETNFDPEPDDLPPQILDWDNLDSEAACPMPIRFTDVLDVLKPAA